MSALESSITLEDVFSVVEAKRVPLAPELAGYLALEVADGAQGSPGEVEPRTVYISEEGTVALVRPKKDAPSGDAETSVRAILQKLLEASGSSTPALTASARRKAGAGLSALVEELEAALIPVNRAAGRRALARLAREVKRVTMGVGRNASVPPVVRSERPQGPRIVKRESSPEDVMSGPDAPPGPRASFTDEAATARRPNQLAEVAAQMNAPDVIGVPSAKSADAAVTAKPGEVTAKPDAPRAARTAAPAVGLTPPPVPGAPAAPPPPVPRSAGASPPARPSAALPPPKGTAPPAVPPPAPRAAAAPAATAATGATGKAIAEVRPEGPGETLFGGDEVDSLLATFEVSSVGEKQMRTDLKAIAGLDPTPAPPDAKTLAELTKDIGKDLPKKIAKTGKSGGEGDGDSVEALLALADASGPLAPPLPPPGFPSKPHDAPLLAPVSAQPPGPAPSNPLAPPSPLVPSAAVGLPLAVPSPLVPITPEGAPSSDRAGAASAPAVDPPLKPPTTPRENRVPAPIPSATASSRQNKGTGGSPPPPKTTGRRTKAGSRATTGSYRQPRAPRTGLVMLVLTLLVLVAGGAAIWMWKPAFFTGRKKPLPAASVSASAVAPQPPRCKVALVVSDVPANAEILLRMGQAPLDVERMPVGTRLEFVATAESYAPRRAIIKADSTWDKAPDGKPRIDVPIQLDPSKAAAGAVDPWPAAEPGSQVGGSGAPGTVHVVSNVRGAEVWLLAGLGPEARIEQLRCDADIDVLLAGPPKLRKRLHVAEKDIQAAAPDAQGNRVVSVSAK